MLLSDWVPRLLTDTQQADSNFPFGADTSGQQNQFPGLLVTDPSDFAPGGKYDVSQMAPAPTLQPLPGYSLSPLDSYSPLQNIYPALSVTPSTQGMGDSNSSVVTPGLLHYTPPDTQTNTPPGTDPALHAGGLASNVYNSWDEAKAAGVADNVPDTRIRRVYGLLATAIPKVCSRA